MQNNVSLKFDCLDIFNLAICNNSIPLIDEVIVSNNSGFNLKNIEIEISSTPSFFSPFVKKVGKVSSGRYIVFNPHDLEIDLTKVMYSAMPINSVVSVKLKSSGEIIHEASKPVLLLPFDYIPPINDYTELISAFVTPNQEDVKSVIPLVLEHLKNDHGVPVNQDMWDYTSKSMTESLIKSIYSAICDLKITFNQTSSTDNKPTKVKLSESVLQYKNATTTELAFLTASVSEYLKINSFIVFTGEKTLVGFFYFDECFDTCVSDDSRAFRDMKDGKTSRFVLIDTTSLINGTSVPFETSSMTAQKAVDSAELPKVIDICRSRKNGYLPMPSRYKQNGSLIFERSVERLKSKDCKISDIFSSPENFIKKIKSVVDNTPKKNISIDPNASIFLIGGTKQIFSKLLFNERVHVKSFPLINNIHSDYEFLDKLIQLNSSIDKNEISSSVNAFNDKNSLYDSLNKISIMSKEEFFSVGISFGAIKFRENNRFVCAPIFISECLFDDGNTTSVSFKLKSNVVSINPDFGELLRALSIDFDLQKYLSSPIDTYEDMLSELSQIFRHNDNVNVLDIVAISAFSLRSKAFSKLTSTEYFKNSNILADIFENGKLVSDETKESYSPYATPFSLDSAQSHAFSIAESKKCSVIQGSDGSGKTTLCAALAFSALERGEKVLYLSNSKSNLSRFKKLSRAAGFDSLLMNLDQPYKKPNVFISKSVDFSCVDNLDFAMDELSSSVNKATSYYESLHSVKEIGFSLYEAVSQYERYRSFPYSVTFTNEAISKLTRDDVVVWFDAVSSLAKAGADSKEPYANPLFYVKEKVFSYDLKSRSAVLLTEHISITNNFINAQNELSKVLGIDIPIMKEEQTEVLLKIAEYAFEKSNYIHYGIFTNKDTHSAFSKIENMLFQCEEFFKLKDFLQLNFAEDVTFLDCEALLSEWRAANSKFAFTKSSALSVTKNKLKSYTKNPKIVTNENFVSMISEIAKYKTAISLIDENAKLIYDLIGIDIIAYIDSDNREVFDLIKKKIGVSREYLRLVYEIYDSEDNPDAAILHNFNLFKGLERLDKEASMLFSNFKKLYSEYKESEKSLVDLLKLDIDSAKEHNNKLWYYFVVQFFERMLENIDFLKYWCNWNTEKEKAISLGLSSVVKLYENEQITSSDVKNAFLKGFFKSVSECFLAGDNNLNTFSSEDHQNTINNILNLSYKYNEILSKKLLKNSYDEASAFINDELKISLDEADNILKRNFAFEINANAPEEYVSLLQKVKPCFVASSSDFLTYFTSLPRFDVILIDSVFDSIPYSAFLLFPLAKRVIVTQPKPLNFGSLLCSYGAPICELNWLYNTGYAYSLVNELFHNNSLSVTPSMNLYKTGVSVVKQLGNYDRKKTRVNVVEASAVVDEVVKYTSDNNSRTIGVYTMTEEQKVLVEVLLQKRMGAQNIATSNNDLFIKSFEFASHEPRDIIIFSTVFSEEEHSKYKQSITKTIPELSKQNSIDNLISVFTSAKSELSLITSLSEESLENFKTTEKNYCVFKKTIERFFDNSKTKIQEIACSDSPENSIIRQVANYVETLGFKVDLDVGCNNAKIDIAVRENESSNYLLGIIFDETAYINSDDFFGRNLTHENFEKLGKWKIHRVFTVEWFENPAKQLDMIASILNEDKFDNSFNI